MKFGVLFFVMSLTARAGDVEDAVKHFYVDLEALAIRGTVDGNSVDRCREVLTTSYKEAFVAARLSLNAWRGAAKREPERFGGLKLPLTEGGIFTEGYESGNFSGVESVIEAGDRAYVKVRIHLSPADGKDEWADLVVLHHTNGRWLIDDILSRVDGESPVSMRDQLVIPPTKQAGQDLKRGQ